MTIWRKLAFIWLLGMACAQAAPKEEPTPVPPPMPQAQNITIFRGRTVEIPLRAVGRASSQLKFLIRTQPKYGKLGEIQFTTRKTAIVTYYHDEKSTATYDSFTYAVQGVGTPVSAPGVVNIAISEEPPALSVIHTLDFGQAWVGEKRAEEIVIRNSGGGSLSGRIIVSEPWKVLGSPEYRLARKEEKKIRLLFAPSDPGEFTAKLLFSHDPRSSVTLSGGAQSPFEFDPAGEVSLTSEPGKTARAGRLKIKNVTPADRVVDLSLPEQVEAPDEITIPANGEATLDLRVKADYLGPLEDRIDLESEGYLRSLPLRVAAVPAMVRSEPAELSFGEVPLKTPVRRTLSLRNEGGLPARLRVEVPKDAMLIPDPDTAVLTPGEKREFEVELELSSEGPYQRAISIGGEGTAPALSIPIAARGIASSPTHGVDAKPSVPTVRPDVPSSLPPGIESSEPKENFSAIPRIKQIGTKALSRKSIELRWKKPAPNAVSSLIEYRSLERNAKGVPVPKWNKWQGATLREESGEVVALLSNLPAGGTWYLRLSSLDETNRRSQPSETLRLVTPNAPQTFWIWVVVVLVLAGVSGYGIHLVRRQREVEARADADRLSKLDA
jgi:hypothetical protein